MKKTILITGGAGYIGSKLVNALIDQRYKVVVIDDFSSGKSTNINPNATYYKTDINSKKISSLIQETQPSMIFHLAALKSIEESISNPERFKKVNVDGSKNILEAARKSGVKKIIFTSTAAVYGEEFTDGFQKESQEPNPISPYGETKLAIEKVIVEYNEKYGMEGIVLRFANVYGPGGKTNYRSAIDIFIDNILRDKQITVFGDGNQTRDFIYINDLVDACVLLCETDYKNKVKGNYIFNIATGKAVSINEVVQIIKKYIEKIPTITYDNKAFYGQDKSILSPELAKKILGWESKTSLENGIKKTISIYKDSSSLLRVKTVSVGIPAYNEEKNIGYLINDILSQKQDNFVIKNIIVSSDGSTDNTKTIVENFNSKKIIFIDNKDRQGQSARQNQIIQKTNSDVLVLINADIIIHDKEFIKKIISPIISNEADLTSSKLLGIKTKTFIEEVLRISLLFKNSLYESTNYGENVYTCHGAVRAFSKNLYTVFRFDQSIAEDAYSYLFCVKNNFVYKYVSTAISYYKLSENISDHKKQSLRFFQSQNYLTKNFDSEFVRNEYKLSKRMVFVKFIRFVFRFPVEMITFSLILLLMRIQSMFSVNITNTWDISVSSKGGRE